MVFRHWYFLLSYFEIDHFDISPASLSLSLSIRFYLIEFLTCPWLTCLRAWIRLIRPSKTGHWSSCANDFRHGVAIIEIFDFHRNAFSRISAFINLWSVDLIIEIMSNSRDLDAHFNSRRIFVISNHSEWIFATCRWFIICLFAAIARWQYCILVISRARYEQVW